DSESPAAHPNSRFTVPIQQTPSLAADWYEQDGVPLDAILFGGRRATNVPLVARSLSWEHGVFVGATISSEKTAAQEGTVGELRRDPFAMLPFCGYNMADYWGHWLRMGETLGEHAPKIFQVNWFRKGDDGRYLWPGFGENSRVIDWVIRRVDGDVEGRRTPIGIVPAENELNLDGIEVPAADLEELFEIDPASWLEEADLTEEFFARFGEKLPVQLRDELTALRQRLSA